MRLIDADALIDRMYHDAFETDTDMQKWDNGCWIRYKMFENAIDDAPTIEPTKEFEWCYDRGYIDAVQGIADGMVRQNLHIAPNEPKRGEWIEKIVDDVKITVCSNCDKEPTFTHYYDSCGNYSLSDFCPNCGADMRGGE